MGYIKPMVLDSNELAEGIFMASGNTATGETSSCYSASAAIVQTPATGFDYYVIQVNGKHAADHTKEAQTLTISFNQPVIYAWGAGTYREGNNTNTLVIDLHYHQNPIDNIGLGDLTVQTINKDTELTISSISITD